MNELARVEAEYLRSDIPEFRPGDTLRVHVRVVEGQKERIQVFQGVAIARRGGGTRETVTVLLGELQSEGMLALKRRQIIVTDPARLAGTSDSPSTQLGQATELEGRLLRQSGREI